MNRARATSRAPRRRPKLGLTVQYASRRPNIPCEEDIRVWAKAACEGEVEVTFRIVNEAEGRSLNHAYRRRDYATNVLTFVYDDARPLSGDVVLCAPVVSREARAQGKTLTAHYAHLVIHGMLHLQGYDHEKNSEARVMEGRETAIMAGLGFGDPYGSEP